METAHTLFVLLFFMHAEMDYDDPIMLGANVVHGFKRGSKELGIPTANLDMEELGGRGDSLDTGIYFGWAKLSDQYYQSVVSVGWNPFYKNEKKTIEAHLLENLDDFYGERLEVALCGFLRQEANFASLGRNHT
jgi:FAD synthase